MDLIKQAPLLNSRLYEAKCASFANNLKLMLGFQKRCVLQYGFTFDILKMSFRILLTNDYKITFEIVDNPGCTLHALV